METCKICGNEFSNLGVHLNKKHHVSRKEYEETNPSNPAVDKGELIEEVVESKDEGVTIPGTDFKAVPTELKETDNNVYHDKEEQPEVKAEVKPESKEGISPTQKTSATPKEIEEAIFGETPDNRDKPLGDFLDEFGLKEEELRSVIGEYLREGFVPIDQKQRMLQSVGEREAMKYKDIIGEEVRITELSIADPLVKIYGFECIKVERDPLPKTWVLVKKE